MLRNSYIGQLLTTCIARRKEVLVRNGDLNSRQLLKRMSLNGGIYAGRRETLKLSDEIVLLLTKFLKSCNYWPKIKTAYKDSRIYFLLFQKSSILKCNMFRCLQHSGNYVYPLRGIIFRRLTLRKNMNNLFSTEDKSTTGEGGKLVYNSSLVVILV